MENTFCFIGKSVPRKDGPSKVTGQAKYTVDIQLPRMLVGRILRSPHPHARILHIDTSRAKRLKGVEAVVTGSDTLGKKYGFVETPRYPPDQYPLAMDRVRFVGEELAAVAAVDEYAAEEALSLIRVDYEPLPAVFEPEEAMQPGAPEIHPRDPKVGEDLANIGGKTATSWGDIEAGFAEAHYIRQDRFESHLRTHGYLEAQATVASYESGDKLNIWTSSQGPFIKRDFLARLFGLPVSAVRVLKTYVGGAFGGKCDFFSHEFCAALLSMKTARPVKIAVSREEIFASYRHGQPLIIEIKTGLKKDGTFVAQQIKTINNCGAYRGTGPVVIFLAYSFAMIPYRVPHFKYDGYSVYTNNPVRTAQRGHGVPQMRFAVESHLDMIAEELAIDPVSIRLKNARQPGEELPNGDNLHNFGLSECITRVAERVGFKEKYGLQRAAPAGTKRRGVGIGVTGYHTGTLIYPNSSCVIVKMNDDGSVNLITGALDIGQGAETILSQIVAEEIKVPLEEVQVTAADTETTPVDIGSWISGGTYVTGNAARIAAGEVRRKLLEIAASEMEVSVADLVLAEKSVYVAGSPEHRLTYAQLVAASIRKRRGDPIIGEGHWRIMRDEAFHPSLSTTKGRWTENYACNVQAVEVEVDVETGEARLLRAVTASDCGFPINPLLVEGQIDGQVSMALGHAFLEEVLMKEGRTLNPNWLEYCMPNIHNVAKSEYIHVITEQYHPDGPFRTKEMGESYVSGILAAIANAIYDAVGVRLYTTPFTPEKILHGLGRF